jgi:hypothetical protein
MIAALINSSLSSHRYLQSMAHIAETYNVNAALLPTNSSSQVQESSNVSHSFSARASKVFPSLTAL